jgi:uncharacterized protein YecT (DUF1311 family)
MLILMRDLLTVFVMLACGLVLNPASAQEKKLSPAEAKALYEKADKALNEAWAAAKQKLPAADFTKLKEEQRAWVEYRDYLARSPLYTGADAQDELPPDAPEYLEAAAGLEDMRTDYLRGLVRAWKEDENMTGRWTDSYGGHVDIVERDGRLYFVMECVRGPTSHIGGIAGEAAWNKTIGWFSDKGREDKGDEGETNLSLTLRDGKLEIIGANTGYYHGARAYFDGHYVKVGMLDAKEQAEVVKNARSGELPEP